MAFTKFTLGLAAAGLMSSAAFAQVTTVTEPAPKFDDNIVRAQFIRPGDVSPEEYAALLAEADKIRAFQNNSNAYTGLSYDAVSSQSGGTLTTDSYGYEIELFESPIGASAPAAGTVITASTPAVMYQAPVTSTITSHYVVKGDTLYNVAKRNGVTVAALKSANGLSTNALQLGQSLRIPSAAVVQSAPILAPVTTTSNLNVAAAPTTDVYAVLPKDTLYAISRRACVSVGEISRANGITDPSALQPGQRLTMPTGHCLK